MTINLTSSTNKSAPTSNTPSSTSTSASSSSEKDTKADHHDQTNTFTNKRATPILSTHPTVIGLALEDKTKSTSDDSDSHTNTDESSSSASIASPWPSGAVNVASCCPELKYRYETCFQRWYTEKFLTGKDQYRRYVDSNGHQQPLECNNEFQAYKRCVRKQMEANQDVMSEVTEEWKD
jgi:hypothetical protein